MSLVYDSSVGGIQLFYAVSWERMASNPVFL